MSLLTKSGFFADEIFDAVFATGVIEELVNHQSKTSRSGQNIAARYLYHRVCTDPFDTHPWIATIRETCRLVAQHKGSDENG